MRNILITGGAGFIGSHICLSLLEEKYNIYIADNFSNSSKKVFDSIRKIMQDKYDLNMHHTLLSGELRGQGCCHLLFCQRHYYCLA